MIFKQKSIFNLATCLTISRFLLVPVFIYYFLVENFALAVIILVIASITDITDGLLARRFNMGTRLGSVLDPLADKFLMLISFLVLSALHVLPWWLALLVIGRDFFIVFGLMYIYYVRHIEVKAQPTMLSKHTTFAQFALLTLSFIKVYLIKSNLGIEEPIQHLAFNLQHALIYITAVLTLVTFAQYGQQGWWLLKRGGKRSL